MLLVVLSVTLNYCNAQSVTIECAKKHLKDRNLEEDLLSYVNPYVGSISDCESAVRVKLASIMSDLRNKLSGNRLYRPFVECTMRDIEEDDEAYEELVLRETAVDMVSGWRFWSYWSKHSRLDELRAQASKIVDRSLLKCKGHRQFGDLFTNIQESITTWDRSGEEEFCIRNYLVTKKLLNPSVYSFNSNPKNVRIESIECNGLVTNVVNKIYDEIKTSQEISSCFLDGYRKNNYADNLLKAEVLSKLSLTKSDKSREKQDFINAMVDITYDTQNC